jgi:hypothetical protein
MNAWINQVFKSKIARRGGMVRRKEASVQKFASIPLLETEVKRREFHMVKHGDQFIIFCDKTQITVIC